MCGIVGYLGTEPEAITAVLDGLLLLQNRGYDSCGISTLHDGELATNKYASTTINNALDVLTQNIMKQSAKKTIAIGHTRWATHGSKTDINAHPHHDSSNRIALVHNGIIENFFELKSKLVTKGYCMRSSTDTEIIAVLIGSLLDEGEPMIEAVRKTVEQLKGTWALVIIHRDYPNKMWAVRNGSPLLLGMSPSCVMVASEQIAFHSYVNQYVVLKDHDVLEIDMLSASSAPTEPIGSKFKFNKNIHLYDKQTKTGENIELTPAPYEHWMLKEICEQPDAVLRALNNGGRIATETTVKLGGLDALQSTLVEIDHLVLLGCGTSYHAGLWSLGIFKLLEMFDTVSLYDGADFSGRDIPRRGKTAVVLLSQSGETKDLHRCVQIIQDHGVISIGVVNVIDSFIARETNCGVYLNAGREVAVASTKSFTNQCVVLSLLAVWFSQKKGTCEEKRRKIIADLHQLPFQMTEVVRPENLGKMENIAEKIRESKSVFLLGKGKEEAIAKEGALKIKEIARIHAEGYSTSALKHGPFGLLEPALPVIILDIGDEYREKTSNAIQEVQARETQTIILYDNKENRYSNGCWIEPNQTFGGLLSNIYLQFISYYCAVKNGFSPDYPRNLAKVVTVE